MKDYSGIDWTKGVPTHGAWFGRVGEQDEVPETPDEASPTPSAPATESEEVPSGDQEV